MSISVATCTVLASFSASLRTSLLLLTLVIRHASNFSSLPHSLTTAAFASRTFIAWRTFSQQCDFMLFLLSLSNALSRGRPRCTDFFDRLVLGVFSPQPSSRRRFSTLQSVADSITDSNVLRAFFLGLHVIWIDENKRLPTFRHCRGSAFHKPNGFGHSLQCSGHEYSGLDVTGVLVSRPKVVHMYPS